MVFSYQKKKGSAKTYRKAKVRKVTATRTATPAKRATRSTAKKTAQSGFSRKINGVTYRSAKAWGAEMQRLRKRKK